MKTIKYGVKVADPNKIEQHQWCECWYEGYAAIKLKTEYTTYDINSAYRYLYFMQGQYPDLIYWVKEKP